MTKKETLERAVANAARQAEALAAMVTAVPAGTLPEPMVTTMMSALVDQLLTTVSPLSIEVEKESEIKRDAASGPRKTISEERLIKALNAHIVRCRITGRSAASKGWKGSVAHHLEMDLRTLRWPHGWDESRILEYLESR